MFEQLGISLAFELLVGLQLQRSEPLIAGVRTFPLITAVGTVAAAQDQQSPAYRWSVPSGILGQPSGLAP